MFQSSPNHIESYYAASSRALQLQRPALQQDMEVDVVVIGAGYTGLYTALNLAEGGRSVVVLEASRIGWGASGRNGGQVIVGFSCDMQPFELALGKSGSREVWRLTQDAAQEIRRRIADHSIECDFSEGHLWTSVLERRVQLLLNWQDEASRKWGYDRLRFIPKAELHRYVGSNRYQAGLIDAGGGHLHPLKYALGLAEAAEKAGVRIFETTRAARYVERTDAVEVHADRGKIRANQIVLACGAFVDQLDRRLQSRILPVGTYMIATEPLGEQRARSLLPTGCAVSDNQFVLDYFRLSADHSLLFGGKCTYTGRTPGRLTEGMRNDMLQVFPQLADVKIAYTWGGHIDITMGRTPDFGQLRNVFWAQGFSGHGVVPTCVAGRVLAEAILGDDTHLRLFSGLKNRPFPGTETLAGLFQVLGMSYYRLRDYV